MSRSKDYDEGYKAGVAKGYEAGFSQTKASFVEQVERLRTSDKHDITCGLANTILHELTQDNLSNKARRFEALLNLLGSFFPLHVSPDGSAGRIYIQDGGEAGQVPSVGFLFRSSPDADAFQMDVTCPPRTMTIEIDDNKRSFPIADLWKELVVSYPKNEEKESTPAQALGAPLTEKELSGYTPNTLRKFAVNKGILTPTRSLSLSKSQVIELILEYQTNE